MSEFSQALETYIYQSGLTENQLAKISGFTRSYIALMKNGQRVSPDTVKLKKLLEALGLSPYEYDTLWNFYLKARYGEQAYELRMNVISFIESFGRLSKISIRSDFHHDIPDIKTINNRMDLEVFVKAVLEQEALNPRGYVRMIMQEGFSFLYNMLSAICRGGNKLAIEHIVGLEGYDCQESSNPGYNLKILGTIMPVMLAGNDNGYNVYYYYEKVVSYFSGSVLMPYVIITSDYVINISADYEYALISREADTHRLFSQLFMQRRKSCKKMLTRIPTGMNMFEYYAKHRPASETMYTIGSQPCFGVFPVDTLVKNYFALEDQALLDTILEFLAQNRQIYSHGQNLTAYFTKSGIQKLMEQGVIDELPSELYISLLPEDRLKLLKMLISAVKGGSYKAYMLDEQKLAYPPELIISAYSLTEVNIIYMPPHTEARFALEEQSITRILYNFLAELDQSTWIYSFEETVQYLEDVYEHYKISL